MMSIEARSTLRRWLAVCCLAALLAPSPLAAQTATTPEDTFTHQVPTPAYFLTLGIYYEGENRDALEGFLDATRGGLKAGQNRWIDSICYHTMSGEVYRRLGDLPAAMQQYNAAGQLFLQFHDWMMLTEFDALRPASAGSVRAVPWGRSRRNALMGSYPDITLINQGRLDNSDALRRGGVVQQAVKFPICAHEIARCTALMLRRRGELLGPLAEHDPLTNQLVAVLSRRASARPGDWSSVYGMAQLGMALTSAGKDSQAKAELERAVLAGGQYDHPLTPQVLLELGNVALRGGDFTTALQYYDEATYAAVNFDDIGTLEEAFQGALQAHMLSNGKGLVGNLTGAAQWAQVQDYRHLQVRLLVLAAENHVAMREPRQTVSLLDMARATAGRRDLLNGSLGAQLNYVQAAAAYQLQRVPQGDSALQTAMQFQYGGSRRLFQMALADSAYRGGSLPARAAFDVMALTLRDPQPADWLSDPLESLSTLFHPHPSFYESWFYVALDRKDEAKAFEIADRARRHRFLASQQLGGRLLALRWVLEGSEALLDDQAKLQRQELLLRFADYQKLSQQAADTRAKLADLPLVPEQADVKRQQKKLLTELKASAEAQELLLREIAVSRAPAELAFPPLRETARLQEALGERQTMLSFFSTSRAAHGFLLTKDRLQHWTVADVAGVRARLVSLLQALGNYHQNKELQLADLASSEWKQPARELLLLLMSGAPSGMSFEYDELVIVPDGLLWYVPFEALPIEDGAEGRLLIEQLRVRYAPTAGLALADARPTPRGGNTAVVLGRLFPNDPPEVAEAAYRDLSSALISPSPLTGVPPIASAIYGATFDRLIVLGDIAPQAGPMAWAPVPLDAGKPNSTLADWIALPWGGPREVLLPGFHSAAEDALKELDAASAGDELFLSACGLMATGSRTVLLSRWRTGGQTSVDLVRELAQELPHTTASEAWQRSVYLLQEVTLDPAREPRLRVQPGQAAPTARHPFFWAGYVLIDTGTSPAAQ